jgi:hypothetical protein
MDPVNVYTTLAVMLEEVDAYFRAKHGLCVGETMPIDKARAIALTPRGLAITGADRELTDWRDAPPYEQAMIASNVSDFDKYLTELMLRRARMGEQAIESLERFLRHQTPDK